MFKLKMGVFTPELELIGLLPDYRSLMFEEKAFSAGTFTIDCSLTQKAKELLRPDYILWFREGSAGLVEYVEENRDGDGPYMTAKGWLLTGILSRRVLWGRYDLTGTPEAIMRRLVDDSAIHPTDPARVIPGLSMTPEPLGQGPVIRKQKTGGSLLEALTELGEAYQVAFGVRFNPEGPGMEFWTRPGADRTLGQTENDPVFFSTELGDVLASNYTYNSSEYRNLALVAGEGEGDERIYITVGGESGEAQTARFIPQDASALSTADGRIFRAASLSGEDYHSAYTGPQIDEGIRKALAGGSGGVTMEQVNAAIQAAILDSWEGSY